MHVDHDNNALCDSYIVEFIHDATKSYYQRGKHGYMYLINIKFPLFMLKVLNLHLFSLPMLVTLSFTDLFSYKAPMHRKSVRFKHVLYMLLDALLYSTLLHMRASSNYHAQLKGFKEKRLWETTHCFIFCNFLLLSQGACLILQQHLDSKRKEKLQKENMSYLARVLFFNAFKIGSVI